MFGAETPSDCIEYHDVKSVVTESLFYKASQHLMNSYINDGIKSV